MSPGHEVSILSRRKNTKIRVFVWEPKRAGVPCQCARKRKNTRNSRKPGTVAKTGRVSGRQSHRLPYASVSLVIKLASRDAIFSPIYLHPGNSAPAGPRPAIGKPLSRAPGPGNCTLAATTQQWHCCLKRLYFSTPNPDIATSRPPCAYMHSDSLQPRPAHCTGRRPFFVENTEHVPIVDPPAQPTVPGNPASSNCTPSLLVNYGTCSARELAHETNDVSGKGKSKTST